MWDIAAACETSVSKIRHYNRLSNSVPSARSCRIAPITPHCECGVTEMACFQHALWHISFFNVFFLILMVNTTPDKSS